MKRKHRRCRIRRIASSGFTRIRPSSLRFGSGRESSPRWKSTSVPRAGGPTMSEITYLEAIREALFEEMERDTNVFCLGEDIGAYGGAFKVTDGLMAKYGESRVIDTPISEIGIVGAAAGAAGTGMGPAVWRALFDFTAHHPPKLTNTAP